MLAPQNVSVFLNNALKASEYQAELDGDSPLPESIREMPSEVSGHLVGLDSPTVHEIEAAWKRVMIFNATRVLYTFTFDSGNRSFLAHKR